ncbi:hypothetical Protein YC6258_03573 [Gynuella sunshinyii YC6258]|uniref:Transposase n=1 Tax=Gynuella sunshinyii YC6258 TaxID=1445510 RepID=A0A0C5VYW5_9GAMM|nr:hypothetical Protein YC6258_03573 [Gynuella sunshinyii YC6258]
MLDWTGRGIREEKQGFIAESLSPILTRLNISLKHWQQLTPQFEKRFRCWDPPELIVVYCSLELLADYWHAFFIFTVN